MKRTLIKFPLAVILFVAVFSLAGLTGCDGSDDNPDGDTDGDLPDGDTDGDIDGDTDGDEPDKANIRAIHLSPDTGAVDVYALGAVKAIENLAFGNSSDYLEVDPGTYSFQVVATGNDVSNAVLEITDAELMVDKAYTAAAFGSMANIQAILLEDDNSAPADGMLRVRAIHAAEGVGEVDVWNIPAEGDPAMLLENFDFGDVGAYMELPAGAYTLGFDVDDDMMPDLTVSTPELSAGLIINLFAVKDAEDLKVIAQLQDGTTVPLMAVPVEGDTAGVRALHLSPDAPSVDVFVDGETKAFGPLAFGEASPFAMLEAGTYDLDIIEADGTVADDLILNIPDVMVEADKSYTALAFNMAASVQAALLVDDFSDVPAGKIRVRAFHAAAEVGAVDVWVIDDSDDSASKVYDDLAFGEAGDYNEALDAGDYTIAFDLDNDDAGDITFDLPNLAAGAVATLFAIKDGSDVKLLILGETGVIDTITGVPVEPAMADVRFIHLAPSTGAVDIYADQSAKLAENLAYTDGTAYAMVDGGMYDVDVVATGATDFTGSVNASVDLTGGMAYTGIAYDDSGAPKLALLEDDRSAPGAGNIRVRAFHAADGVGEVDIWDITDINDPAPLFADLAFGAGSDAAVIPAGSYTIGFDTDDNGTPDVMFELPELTEGAIVNLFALNDTTDGVVLVAQFDDGTVSDPILPVELAFVRVLHLSRTAGAVDIYVDGATTPAIEDLAFRAGTGYIPFAAGEYDFDIAPANMTIGDSVYSAMDVPLAPGQFYSIVAYNVAAVVKNGAESLKVSLIDDDVSIPDEGMVRLRGFHNAFGVGTVDVWDLSDIGMPMPVLTDLEFEGSTGELVRPAGQYRLGLDASGNGDADLIFDLPDLAAGAIVDLFAVTDDMDNAYLVAYARDGSTLDIMGEAKFFLRILHLTPGAPTVDVWADGSVMLADDLAFGDSTEWLELTPDTYDVNITPNDSTASLKDFNGIAFEVGKIYTAYAYGDVTDMADFMLGLIEESYAGLFEGDIRVRPIHAAFGVGTVDIWDATVGGSESVLYQNVPYGAVGSYEDLDAGMYTLVFDTNPNDTTLDQDVTFMLPDLEAGLIANLFAVNDSGVKLVAAFQDGSVSIIDPTVIQ